MTIMKFGGSSLGSGQRMLHVAEIVKKINKSEKVIVVASAIYKVTDKLISIFQKYKSGELRDACEEIKQLYKIHKQVLNDLKLPVGKNNRVYKAILEIFGDLSIQLILNDNYSIADYDYCISFGEKLSSCLLAAALNKISLDAKAIDASLVLVADGEFGNAKALLRESQILAKRSLLPLLFQNVVPVVAGFYAGSQDGKVMTLGRGGSDYSATVLANILNAQEVILWKEVDGVFSGDPKIDKNAQFYPELSYAQALFLAEKGAKVLHPEAIKPVASKEIVVRVKNTFKPDFIGSKIWKGSQ